MATRWLRWPLGGLLTLSVALGTTAAWGSPCIQDAKGEYRNCKASCVEDFQVAKDACLNRDHPCRANCREDFQVAVDACLNRDHACVEQCRADRQTCRQPTLDRLSSDIAACNARRDSDIQNCKDLYADGTPERDQCIDNAQVAGFECRDQAREDARPGLQTCREHFRDCVRACPPAS